MKKVLVLLSVIAIVLTTIIPSVRVFAEENESEDEFVPGYVGVEVEEEFIEDLMPEDFEDTTPTTETTIKAPVTVSYTKVEAKPSVSIAPMEIEQANHSAEMISRVETMMMVADICSSFNK